MPLLDLETREINHHDETRAELRPLSLIDSALSQFQNIAHEVKHPGGSVIFREGDPAMGVYLVCMGQVKLIAESTDQRRMILKIARPGDLLGLSATLNDLPYEVTAETLMPCSFKHIDEAAFLNFVRSSAEAGYTTARLLAKEHHEIYLGARRLALAPSASARLAHVLIGFLRSENTRDSAHSFLLLLTHSELANLAGMSRETVTRLLNQFERDRIIARNNSIITVIDLSQLEQLAN